MAGPYTLKKLTDVDDSATKFGYGEVQEARFGPTVWGVQLHPEVDEHILAEWAAEDPDRYAEGVLEDVLAQIAEAREELEAGWRPLAQALADLP